MINTVLYIAIAMLVISLGHAESIISQVKEGISQAKEENAAIEKVEAIKNKATWKGEDGWFFNIAKEGENRFLIQQVKIIPQKSLTDVPQIVTLSIHVDPAGSVTDEKIDSFVFPVDTSMASYLDKGIISRDRGGLIGAAVGSVPEGCSGGVVPTSLCDDLAENVFPKFYEWKKIAQEKNVAPFIKYFDGRKFYDTWDESRGATVITPAHGGGLVYDEKRHQKLKEKMEHELQIEIQNQSEPLNHAFHIEVPRYGMQVSSVSWETDLRKKYESDLFYEEKKLGIIHEDPYVPAVMGRDPSYEQTGWVFVWKSGNAYAFKIQNKQDLNGLNLLLNGGQGEVAIANLSGDILLSRVHIDGLLAAYNFLQEVRGKASKYVSDYAALQSKQSFQQDELFK